MLKNIEWGMDWSQNSTKRGAVWLFFGILAIVMLMVGKKDDVPILMAVAANVVGGMGLAIKD